MSYNVGFDLGTHQTKICIQDSTNPAEKTYEFLEFEKPNGEKTVLFPSIVQINKDHTLSYGFYDPEDSLLSEPKEIAHPRLELLPIESLSLPTVNAPYESDYPKCPPATLDDTRDNESEMTPLKKWCEKCNKLNQDIINDWSKKSSIKIKSYISSLKQTLNANVKRIYDFEKELKRIEIENQPHPLRFRYFKQAALLASNIWKDKDFTPSEVASWYIGYILLILKEKLGEFTVQFGVPCGASNTGEDNKITFSTYKLFISAADLIKKFENLADYKAATYEELREKTEPRMITSAIIDEYYFDDVPEAFAGLVSVTSQKKLGMGFHLLVDIGGGTTDLALFTISNDLTPNVHSVSSFPIGLNSIFETRQLKTPRSLELIQNDFFKHPNSDQFKKPVEQYKRSLKEAGNKTTKSIEQSFAKSYNHHRLKTSRLTDALNLQPIIYCGGGSMFNALRTPLGYFNDIRILNKEILDIRNLINEESIDETIFPILSISYGLASYIKEYDKKIECVDLSDVFETFLPKAVQQERSNSYEHGLTDVE